MKVNHAQVILAVAATFAAGVCLPSRTKRFSARIGIAETKPAASKRFDRFARIAHHVRT